ncbi:hypothetical protein Neosp_005787 [[Neocosmospora] mangrovei]
MPSFRTLHRIRQQLFGDAVLIDDEAALGSDPTKSEKRVVGHAATEDLSHRWTVANADNGLVKLPTELHMMIMEQLTFGQVESLRRTCRALRGRISKPVIREVFPGIKFELLSTCYRCLCYDPLRDTLIRADESDARYPLASECLDCVAARGGFMVGRSMFRVINVLGNTVLMSEYKLWRRHRPGQSPVQRVLSKTAAILVFWTYPQSVEQKYPGKWWLTRRELQQV